MIEYIDIHKSFDVPVLHGVNLAVESGETVGLVGPSGTGKSVLLKTTNGLIIPDCGDVRIDGESLYHGAPDTLERQRCKIGYVFQYAALLDSMDVRDNVSLGIPEREARKLEPDEILHRVIGALEAVRLAPEQVMHKLPAELSGGMRKRVGLARAIIGRPRVLLYDEPMTGLDPVTSAAVERLIRELAEELEATSVVVTHDVVGALELCDRMALMDRGRIRFAGTPEEFRNSTDPLVRAFADRRVAEQSAAEDEW